MRLGAMFVWVWVWLAAGSTRSMADSYTLEFTYIVPNAPRPIQIRIPVRESDARDIEAQPSRLPPSVIETGKKKLAERQGYTSSLYGPDYWKMIQVTKWFYDLTETRSSRLVASNRTPTYR